MQKKLIPSTQGWLFILLVVFLTACQARTSSDSSKSETSTDSPEITQTVEQVARPSTEQLTQFEQSLTPFTSDLRELESSETSVPTENIVSSYQKLGSDPDFLEEKEQDIFNQLEQLKDIEFSESSPLIGNLQQNLIDLQFLDRQAPTSQYGPETNNALIAFLNNVKDKVSDLQDKGTPGSAQAEESTQPSGADSNNTGGASQDSSPMSDFIIPSLFGLALLVASAGLAVVFLRFRRRLIDLENEQSRLESQLQNATQTIHKQESKQKKLSNEVNELSQKLADIQQSRTTTARAYQPEPIIQHSPPSPSPRRSFQGETQAANTPTAPRASMSISQNRGTLQEESSPPLYLRLVKQYNDNPSSLATYAAGVSQTQESLKKNLQDSSQTSVTLAQDNSPNYWIVKDEADNFWLFPREGWEPSIGTLESFVKLFKFTGNPSRRYQVVKPASVTETGRSDWSLREPGEIEFS